MSNAIFTTVPSNGGPASLWKSVTDENGHKTWYAGPDARARPGTIVEGWVDSNSNGTFDAADLYQRRRDFTYHPRLADPLTATEKSL